MTIRMNVTYKEFLAGFEEAIERLPGILEDWSNLDEDLQYEYKDQINWMLENQWQAKELAVLEGHGPAEIEDKFSKINTKYLELADKILYETGLNIKEIIG